MSKRKYELMVIIKPDMTQKQTEGELKKVREFISSQQGEIFHEDLWGMRAFAYKMKKYDSGYYAIFYFNGDPQGNREIERSLRLENGIFRFLTVSLPDDYEIKTLDEFESAEYDIYADERSDSKAKAEPKAKKAAK